MPLRVGIRIRTIILSCVAALPLLVIAVYNARQTESEEREDAYREMLVLARSLASIQADVVLNTRQLLYGLAAGFEDKPEALFGPGCEHTLRRVAEGGPVYANIAVADLAGKIRCSAERLERPISIAERKHFQEAVEFGSFTISEVITGQFGGDQMLIAAQPINNPFGAVSAVLLASIHVERLGEVFGRAAPPADVVATLVDGEGRVMARRPHVAEYVGRIFEGFREIKAASIGREEDIATLVGLDGVARVVAYSRLRDAPGPPLYVIAGVSEQSVTQQSRQHLRRNLTAIAITLVLALTMGMIGAQRLIVGPLRQLTDAARRYRRGDLTARSGLSHAAGEVGSLARAFDDLAVSNQRLNRAMRALSAGNRTLLREKHNEAALLNSMCKVAVEEAGYRLAFVNYAQHDEAKTIRAMARAGHDEGFIDSLQVTWSDVERGRATTGTAIRTGKTSVIRSVGTDPRFALWRDAAIARGYGSVASFPLVVDDAVIGTFTLVAAEEDAFDEAELTLLDEMAADLAFGIEVLRSNARREEAEERARRAITHDPLTGLPGRIPFIRSLEEAIGRVKAETGAFGVLAVCLPNLQDLHDSLGYEATNAAVREAASRLRFSMSPATALARIGGDEFALLVPQATGESLEDLARRLLALVAAPLTIGIVPIALRMGIGAVLYPEHGADADLVLRRATIAARVACNRDPAFYLYAGPTERESPDRLALASQLREAIEKDQLLIHLQPKVSLESRRIQGAEALVRWQHPDKGMVPPMQFVPIAEQTGLIRPMTIKVIELAVRQLAAWDALGIQQPIAVNLSPRNFHDPDLLDQVQRMLGTWNVPATSLEFEITESALAEDPQAARSVLQKLRSLGCKLYIDDFGTGYSSLSYLVTLPVDALKIDRSFVKQMTRTKEARAVVSSVISLAAQLGLQTIAEGVETAGDADLLQQLGCDAAQGYFFARPAPADKLNL